MDFGIAVATFAEGFAFTRSFTHPYLAERLRPNVWWLHDGPRRSGSERKEELLVFDVAPEAVLELARSVSPNRPRICVLLRENEDDAPLRAAMKVGGARLMATEGLFVHDLANVIDAPSPLPVSRLKTADEADSLAKAAGRRVILPRHLDEDPPSIREYVCRDGTDPVGWVGSVAASGCGWVTWMFVEEAYRRRGIARALMARLLADDIAQGFASSVLLASHAGGLLYPAVGYHQIGTLYLFNAPHS